MWGVNEQPIENNYQRLEDLNKEDENEDHFPETQIQSRHAENNKVSVTYGLGSLRIQTKNNNGKVMAV